jgi:hypothetical protein
MTTIRKREDGTITTEAEYRAAHPQTSFPAVIDWDNEGYDVVFPSPAPPCDLLTQGVRQIDPVLTEKGHYEQAWEVFDLDADTIAANAAAKRRAKVDASRIISPRQIRQALTAAGLRASVEAAVAAADQDTKDWWEFATQFECDHPMVAAMATALGVSDTQLEDLWILGATL